MSGMRRGATAALAVVVLGAVLAGWGMWSRNSALASLKTTTDEDSVPQVEVIPPEHGPATRNLDLPGNVNAWYEAPIYAQVAGYVQHWYKDYGAPVKAGDLLATISAPALDEQLGTAEADLGVAQTRYKLALVTAKRYQALAGTQAVAQQDVDVQTAGAAAQQAQVEAAQHEVARYQALEAFKRIVAPFDGVVTARRTDVGNFVNPTGGDAGSASANAELFTVADIHKLRVFVSVPEDYSGVLKPGLKATLTLPQFPGRKIEADYATTARAFNPQSRSVVTELTVENRDHEIWPGTFASVHFTVPADQDVLIVPEQALMFRAQGMQVALVGADNHVHLQDVTLGLNLGRSVQVVSGLKPDDRLINDPSAGLLEGELVHAVTPAKGYAAEPDPAAAPGASAATDGASKPGPVAQANRTDPEEADPR